MNTNPAIEPVDGALAVLEELKRQRTEGVRHLYIEDSTLAGLEKVLGADQTKQDVKNISARPVPEISQGRAVSFPQVEEVPPSTVQEKLPVVQSDSKANNPKLLSPPQFSLPAGNKQEQWEWLKDKVTGCDVCKSELNPQGKIVFGIGDLDADLFFCGEAPGAEEEIAGEPFVGPAGELLNRILAAMGLSRESVYIANMVNFRPRHERSYGNRPPSQEEMNFCLPYLRAQVEIVQPKVLVALGKTATDGLLGVDPQRRLGQMRGTWHEYANVPMMVTYHPSYLLHNPSKSSKRKVWEDMLLVMEKLELPISEKQRDFFQ
ncbi:MAG: uracil-DNA glycosylase [Opitutae bacterium]|nr:uracil-DNA glycosylase [Opitutae bacterium]|tara:strand:- start:1148 stop:2104 length:957 start_codon:yes stop_codon:yes gene_type:complete